MASLVSNKSLDLKGLLNAHFTTLEEDGTFHNNITPTHLKKLVLVGKFYGENLLQVAEGNQFKRLKNHCPSLYIHGERTPISAPERALLLSQHKDFAGISAKQIIILYKKLEYFCKEAGLNYKEIKELPYDDVPFATPKTSRDVPMEVIEKLFTDLNQFDINIVVHGAVRASISYRRKNPQKGFYAGDLQVPKEANASLLADVEALNRANTFSIGDSGPVIAETGRSKRATTMESSRLSAAKEATRKEAAAKRKTRKRKVQEEVVEESPPRVFSKYELYCQESRAAFHARVDANMKKKGF